MPLSIISDLYPFVRQRYRFPGVNGGVERLHVFRYVPLNLALLDRFWIFLSWLPRRIIVAIFVPAATLSATVVRTLAFPMMPTKLFRNFLLAH
jgi:hypothetical protein